MGGARLKVAGGNWVTARPAGVRDGVDHQLTGEVRRIDIATIREVLAQGRIALLSPIGYSLTGEIFNLRAGEVAQAVATGLGATSWCSCSIPTPTNGSSPTKPAMPASCR